jgi:hypothetical protein
MNDNAPTATAYNNGHLGVESMDDESDTRIKITITDVDTGEGRFIIIPRSQAVSLLKFLAQ